MAIGDKMLALRKQHGWSQQLLAKKVGTSGPIIGRYERGEMTPSVEVAKKLADIFAVTLDYLVDDTGKAVEIKDKAMLQRVIEIEALEQEDKKTIVQVIDSLLRDAKAKKAYAVQEELKSCKPKASSNKPINSWIIYRSRQPGRI
jgi:transcriptional regulator with XRE-family HTH domain